ncbi:hypothetical protein IW261DRAFT_1414370 [Armillaria novae-zelandiae]|uniref:Uncharacterized protein n=1 Tax=Armillaria novae-zelandiae TaxID=153914 RepID=A0AA39PTK6_9AGAR|nr:hypothetical protein IW261DRAFT_1414370 [Armillaria novae-zelandiae]
MCDLLKCYCPHGAGEALITKVEYMKSSRVPNHKFLLCHVKDPQNIRGRDTVIRIERFSDSAPPSEREPRTDSNLPSLQPPAKERRPLASESMSDMSSHSSSPSLFGQALDVLAIYCMPVIEFKDYDVLSTLTFNDDSTFASEQAAVMAMVASDAADEYSIISHQCYWYAWVIFNIILETQAGQYTKTPLEDDKHMGRRGKVKIVNDAASNIFIPPSDTLKRLVHTYLTKWLQWQVDIEGRKNEKDAPLRDAEAAAERERREKLEAEAVAERERQEKLEAEAVAERERREKLEVLQRGREDKLEAQRREENLLQRAREDNLEAQRREESLLRKLQRRDEELAMKQKEFDDYKKDQVLRLDWVSPSRPNAI